MSKADDELNRLLEDLDRLRYSEALAAGLTEPTLLATDHAPTADLLRSVVDSGDYGKAHIEKPLGAWFRLWVELPQAAHLVAKFFQPFDGMLVRPPEPQHEGFFALYAFSDGKGTVSCRWYAKTPRVYL